jgi:TolB-like protein/tetratricopeptide (TPR) repeat protein
LATLRAGSGTAPQARASSSPYPVQNVAVLYFEDHTARGGLGYLARGLTERLVDDLARVGALRVISTNGVRRFREADIPPDSIARVLKVGTLVTGSLQGSERDLRVTVRLVDPSTGRLIATRTMRGDTDDVLRFETWVGEVAAEFLRPRLGSEIRLQERAAGTRDVRARTLFLQGLEQWESARRMMPKADPLGDEVRRRRLAAADAFFADAARRDRHWGDPLVLRGWVSLARWEGEPEEAQRLERFQDALAHAEEALKRRPGDPAALELRGTVQWKMSFRGPIPTGMQKDTLARRAEEDLRDALAADSSLARAWATLAQVLRVQEGQLAAAKVAARRALEEDAFLEEGPYVVDRLYRAELDLARYDSAVAWCREGGRRYPDDWHFVECRLNLLGYDPKAPPDLDGAWNLYRELGQLDPPQAARAANRAYSPIFRRMAVARVAARAGLADSARALIRISRREAGNDSTLLSSLLYDEAVVWFFLGENEAALSLLEAYVRAKPEQRRLIATDPKFESLRNHPRYRRLAEPPASRSEGVPARSRDPRSS